MSETAKSKSQSYLEPVICDVRTPIKQVVWGQPYQSHKGSVTIDIKKSHKIKELILIAAAYKEIKLPYRFTLTSGEIIYEKNHIKTVNLAGFYLSGIDLVKVQGQLSSWKTEPPPETFFDIDEIVMSDKFNQRCYFVAHQNGEEVHAAWNLAENFDVYQNPHKYSGVQWHVIDLTK